MKLFFYYVTHSALNALKKLFKTWVLVFFVVMLVGGLLFGGLIGLLASKAIPDEGEEPGIEAEIQVPEAEPEDEVPVMEILELAAGAVVLLFFTLGVFGADKSGADIFQPADVALLFSAPLKPQSVLMFRTMTQIGASIAATFYISVYQLPNLARNTQLSGWGIVAILAGWVLTIGISQLLKMLCFVTASVHPGFKKNLRRIVAGLLALIAVGFYVFMQRSGLGLWEAVLSYFNAPASRYIPFWGWIKGFVMFTVEKNSPGALASLAAVLLGGAGLAWMTWHIKADFYEEALSKAAEKAEMMEAARDASLMKRKKDRSEKIRRNEFSRGQGANVFFWKAVYNRFRFAHFGFLTKTLEFYLVVGVGIGLFCRFVVKTDSYLPVVIALAVCAFFRSLGNALKEDTKMWYFLLIPEDNWAKLMYSLAGDLANCFLDVLPGLVLGLLLQGAPLYPAVLWIFAIVSLTAYATSVGTFIDMSVRVNAGSTLKQLVQIIFIYFGLLPDVAVVGVLLLLKLPLAAVLAVTAVNTALSALFLLLATAFMGKK